MPMIYAPQGAPLTITTMNVEFGDPGQSHRNPGIVETIGAKRKLLKCAASTPSGSARPAASYHSAR